MSDFPSNAQIAHWNELTRFTPDLSRLELSEFQLFFVADDMRKDCISYPKIMSNSAFVALAFTSGDFNYYVKNNGDSWLPIPLEVSSPSHFVKNARIFGELHYIESSFVPNLDIRFENGYKFLRKRVKITYPYRILTDENVSEDGRPLPHCLLGKAGLLKPALSSERLAGLSAWMYVGIPEYWEPLIDGGYTFQQVKTRQPLKEKVWLKEYYDITKPIK